MKTIHLDRAVDHALVERAEDVCAQYRLTLDADGNGGFIGSSMELPRVFGEGPTVEDCVRRTREMLVWAVVGMLKSGKTPPHPVRERRRDEQINLRVSADEKLLLEASARQQGFRSVSDFVRSKALAGVTAGA